MMQAAPSAVEVIWSFTLLFLVFFVLRALLCWYLKINKVIKLLVEIKILLGGKEAPGDDGSVFPMRASIAALKGLRERLVTRRL